MIVIQLISVLRLALLLGSLKVLPLEILTRASAEGSTFGMKCRVVRYNFNDDSGNHTASIIRDEENFRKSAYFSIMKLETLWSSETSVDFFPIKALLCTWKCNNIGASIAQLV